MSLYFDVGAEDDSVRGRHTRLERVPMAANLRHARVRRAERGVRERAADAGLPFEDELRTLWRFAGALEARRGRPSAGARSSTTAFHVEGERVRIVPRKRGAPLDKLVAELMILANSTWGELLAERDVAAHLPRAVGRQGAHERPPRAARGAGRVAATPG